jgi:predicted ATP-dependent protease
MSDEERASFAERGEEIEREAKEIMQKAPRVHREMHERERQLQRETAVRALEPLFAELRRRYDQPAVVDYLKAVEEDACENYKDILSTREKHPSNHSSSKENGQPQSAARHMPPPLATDGVLRRYRVNLLVEREPEAEGAPVHYEDHPSFANIAGRVDYMVQMGTLVTDFNLIKPGALHKANGGYLVMDALKLLMQPLVWEALKRSIRAGQARLETPEEELGLFRTASLEPGPIPLDIKIVLLGSPLLYHLLLSADPDFGELFKVVSDFGSDIERTAESEALYARMIATFIQKDKLLPFDRAAVQRVVERNSRIIGDARRLSARIEAIRDLLREAHYWATHSRQEVVHDEHVERAIEAQEYRSDRVRERIGEEIQRGTILIETDGARIGQVNALSVFAFGDFFFGRPSKVTARTRAGRGEFLDIERAVTLGEPIHSKGVLILRGFLAGRYVRSLPLSLSASLVFEQSYGPVEGDSASLAELCALLSSIAEAPVRQSMAITGSVDQQGDVQPVGAINEKIEGFFNVCRSRGLTGDQGVILPAANVQHLMLRKDVIEAVANGRFHLYPVSSVDEAAEVLTGMPPEALNGRVSANLEKYARERRRTSPNGEQEAEETPELAELLKV